MEEDNERQSRETLIASIIREMTYGELISLATSLVDMQKAAKDDGWEWKPSEANGEFGLAAMLYSWTENFD